MVDFLAAGEACKAIFLTTQYIKSTTFYNFGFSIISASAYPTAEKVETGLEGKNEVECTGQAEIIKVEFLPQEEACKRLITLGFLQ